MKIILVIMCFIVSVNAEFITSMFLEKVETLKYMNIYYENKNGEEKIKKIPFSKGFKDDVMIISETKKNNFFRNINLDNPEKINSLEVRYIDKNKKNINLSLKVAFYDRDIKSNNLYIYQNEDYDEAKAENKSYQHDTQPELKIPLKVADSKKRSTYRKQPKILNKTRKQTLVPIRESFKLKFENVEGFFTKQYDIIIEGCENKRGICDKPYRFTYYQKGKYWKIVFYFAIIKNDNTFKEFEFDTTKFKKIQNAKHGTEAKYEGTHLVFTSKYKITNIENTSDMPNKLKYRISYE